MRGSCQGLMVNLMILNRFTRSSVRLAKYIFSRSRAQAPFEYSDFKELRGRVRENRSRRHCTPAEGAFFATVELSPAFSSKIPPLSLSLKKVWSVSRRDEAGSRE